MAPPVIFVNVGVGTVKLIKDLDKLDFLIERDGSFERDTIAAWAEACADGAAHTAIDVGAYSGLFAIGAWLLGNHVIAIEPHPDMAQRLRDNVQLNRASVHIIEAAATNRDGRGTLWKNGARNSVISSLTYGGPAHNRNIEVKTVKIDSLPYKGKVGAIKIDVEGHEAEVVEGAIETIRRDQPLLLIETLEDEKRQRRIRNLLPNYRCAGFLDERNMHMVPIIPAEWT